MDLDQALGTLQATSAQNTKISQDMANQQMQFQSAEAQKMRDFNSQEAIVNRDWQEMMSNSAHQREVADLKKAGLNPILAAGGQGASVGTGATASQSGSPTGSKGDVDSAIGAMAQLVTASINSSATLAAASMSASAMRDVAQINKEAAQYSADKSYKGTKLSSTTSYLSGKYSADKRFDLGKETLGHQRHQDWFNNTLGIYDRIFGKSSSNNVGASDIVKLLPLLVP